MPTRAGIIVIFLIITQVLCGQSKPRAEVSVEKNRVLLGEPFRFRMQVIFPEGTKGAIPIIDSIPHFEFTKPPEIDSTSEKAGRSFKAVYYLSSFDSGHWVIPAYPVTKNIRTDTLGIDVVFSPFDTTRPYHDIKDIIEVKTERRNPWWWYAAGAALVLLMAGIYISRRKKKPSRVMAVSTMDPFREAMKELEALKKSRGNSRDFHTGLTGIFRVYVFRRKGILSLQKTTEGLVDQLKNLSWPGDQLAQLTRALQVSDLVKFARYQSDEAENNDCLEEVSKAIRTLESSHRTDDVESTKDEA